MTSPMPPYCARPLVSEAGRQRLPGLLREHYAQVCPAAQARASCVELTARKIDKHHAARAASSELAYGCKPDPAAGPR